MLRNVYVVWKLKLILYTGLQSRMDILLHWKDDKIAFYWRLLVKPKIRYGKSMITSIIQLPFQPLFSCLGRNFFFVFNERYLERKMEKTNLYISVYLYTSILWRNPRAKCRGLKIVYWNRRLEETEIKFLSGRSKLLKLLIYSLALSNYFFFIFFFSFGSFKNRQRCLLLFSVEVNIAYHSAVEWSVVSFQSLNI